MQEAIRALVRIKHIIDGLSELAQTRLSETERQAVQDCLSQAYDRAAYFAPQGERLLEQESQQDQQQTNFERENVSVGRFGKIHNPYVVTS